MRFSYSLLASAALLAGAPAFAQANAPFTGVHVEGLVGGDRLQNGGGHRTDLMYGVGAGYDLQARGAVIGIEGEATDSRFKECEGSRTAADPRICAKTSRDLYIGGRIGKVVGGRALLYVKAGYTNARLKVTADDGATKDSASGNLDGVRVGAGAEVAVGSNAYVKAEYRYSNYEQGFERHQLVGGVGFRF